MMTLPRATMDRVWASFEDVAMHTDAQRAYANNRSVERAKANRWEEEWKQRIESFYRDEDTRDDVCQIAKRSVGIDAAIFNETMTDLIRRARLCFWDPPCVVMLSRHYGRPIGDGLFALVPLMRGQLLCQFEGTMQFLMRKGISYFDSNQAAQAMRRRYCLPFNYGGTQYIINPLVEDHFVGEKNAAGFINEPSAPPFVPNEWVVLYADTKNLVRVVYYDYANWRVVVTRDGERLDVHPRDIERPDVTWFASVDELNATYATYANRIQSAFNKDPTIVLQKRNGTFFQTNGAPTWQNDDYVQVNNRVFQNRMRHKTHYYEANCTFFDFPVPIEMYDVTGDVATRRTDENHCDIKSSLEELVRWCSGGVDARGKFTEPHRFVPGAVLFLRPNIFEGLRPFVHVTDHRGSVLKIRVFVESKYMWRLPNKIKVARVGGKVIPFPLVYIHRDVKIGQELLCIYDRVNRLSTRGISCDDQNCYDSSRYGAHWSHMCD